MRKKEREKERERERKRERKEGRKKERKKEKKKKKDMYLFVVDVQLLKRVHGDEDVPNVRVDELLLVPLHQMGHHDALREARREGGRPGGVGGGEGGEWVGGAACNTVSCFFLMLTIF